MIHFRHMALTVALLATGLAAQAAVFKGRVSDKETGEDVIGAFVTVREQPGKGAVTGLDGSFNLETGLEECTILCSCIGYKDFELHLGTGSASELEILLETDMELIESATVSALNPGRTYAGARAIEKQAENVVNVMSAKAMELSPDVTVAGVIQRMSGVTVERNSSGEGQYAVLRGMDKRYSYTLVNGVKIPSPDNKNRFVPLDIFPSEMLDRLEVTKSLTADMEGDGTGGAVNMVMKDAPQERQLTASVSTGGNAMYLGREFQSFSHRTASRLSPYEAAGKPVDYKVTASDFTTSNLHVRSGAALPDLSAGFSYGDRFLGGKLGLMAAASLISTARGKESEIHYQPGTTLYGIEYRNYSSRQARLGTHLKTDYIFNPGNRIMLYGGYMDMSESEVRDGSDDKEWSVRMKHSHQYIFNTTLKGEHSLNSLPSLKISWDAVVSKAFSETPDNVLINMLGTHLQTSGAATRRWEHNSDRDLSAYLRLDYGVKAGRNGSLDLSAGSMYRDKVRSSFFNEYSFNSATGTSAVQVYGTDWNNFDELQMVPRSYGNIGDPLNYDASEKIAAGWFQAIYAIPFLELTAGVRVEHTDQGYELRFPRDVDPEGRQVYADILPDFHLKWMPGQKTNVRFSYARTINRPSFFEIVPYSIINEDYKEKGNPDLKHMVADNLDLRYEFFPKSSEQLMVGLFYKNLRDPIEYGLITEGQDCYYKPMNFGDAVNMGIEVDVMKYFNWFGFKANYTYTHSRMTTTKYQMEGSEIVSRLQTRPLFGQAAHVANLSLLFKDGTRGLEGQISGSYTGKRLSDISNWYEDDVWEDGFFQLDLSAEKAFRNGLCIFAKASNLLDTPVLRFVNSSPHTDGEASERVHGDLVERRERHGQSVVIGIRFKL